MKCSNLSVLISSVSLALASLTLTQTVSQAVTLATNFKGGATIDMPESRKFTEDETVTFKATSNFWSFDPVNVPFDYTVTGLFRFQVSETLDSNSLNSGNISSNFPIGSSFSVEEKVMYDGGSRTLQKGNYVVSLIMVFVLNNPQMDFQTFTVNAAESRFMVIPEPIPEPLTILGSGTACGFGALFKRQLNKNKKRETEKV